MIYALMIWTVVGMAGTKYTVHTEKDWRPIAEFQVSPNDSDIGGAQKKCEAAAKQLVIDPKLYRCVKLK